PGREPVGARVRADVVQPQRLRVGDEQAEDAAPARQVADGLAGLGVDAAGDEALKLDATVVEDAQRGVAGAGHAPGDLEQLADDALEIELGHETATGLDQLPQAGSVKRCGRKRQRSAEPTARGAFRAARARAISSLQARISVQLRASRSCRRPPNVVTSRAPTLSARRRARAGVWSPRSAG